MDRPYKRGFEDALELLLFLIDHKKMDCKEAISHLMAMVKEDKIHKLMREL